MWAKDKWNRVSKGNWKREHFNRASLNKKRSSKTANIIRMYAKEVFWWNGSSEIKEIEGIWEFEEKVLSVSWQISIKHKKQWIWKWF